MGANNTDGAELAARTRLEQGLPPTVTDLELLARVAAVIRTTSARERRAS